MTLYWLRARPHALCMFWGRSSIWINESYFSQKKGKKCQMVKRAKVYHTCPWGPNEIWSFQDWERRTILNSVGEAKGGDLNLQLLSHVTGINAFIKTHVQECFSKTSYNSPKYPSLYEQINCGIFKLECHRAARMNQLQQHKMLNLTNLMVKGKRVNHKDINYMISLNKVQK